MVLATGRMHRSALPFMKMLDLKGPIISSNGGHGPDSETDMLYRHVTVRLRSPKRWRHGAIKKTSTCRPTCGTIIFSGRNASTADVRPAHRGNGDRGGPLAAFIKEEPTKMIIVNEPPVINTLYRECLERYGDRLEITVSKSMYLEFLHR